MSELSVLVPSRNEEWLKRTVDDVLLHRRAQTEIIVVLDGAWPDEPLPQHPDVQVVYQPTAIGQRAATNLAARLASAPYIMKLDAHCSVAEGFDRVLLDAVAELGPDVVQIPAQHNLHAYDWVCRACGRREYQCGLLACRGCNSPDLVREMIWQRKPGLTTVRWSFDSDLKFQYWHGGKDSEFVITMSCLGACWFQSREQFLRWGGLDEAHGSWGQVGTELGCKAWLSGGKMLTNRRTWFAHFFRVGGHQIPYHMTGSEQEAARVYSRDLWRNNKWPQQVRPLKWLVEKFQPHGWTPEQIAGLGSTDDIRIHDPGGVSGDDAGSHHGFHGADPPRTLAPAPKQSTVTKGLIYYTDGALPAYIDRAVRQQLERIGLPIVAVSLKHLHWPVAKTVTLPLERGYLAMFQQILVALELSTAEYIFFCEHDVIYAPENFTETPISNDLTYQEHVWKVSAEDGRALHYRCRQTSGLSGPRHLLLDHYRKRVDLVRQYGYNRNMGFEPGTHRRPQRVDDLVAGRWMSTIPSVDIRHGCNLSRTRWRRDQFRNQKYTAGWTEADAVPGWGKTAGRFHEFLEEITRGAPLQAVG